MILHTFQTSPFGDQRLLNCLGRIQQHDGVLLLQDACYLLNHPNLLNKLCATECSVLVLDEDIAARGLTLTQTNIKTISYAEFVELSMLYDKVISW